MKTHYYKVTNGPLDKVKMKVEIPDRILFAIVLLKAKTTNTPVPDVILSEQDILDFLALAIKLFNDQYINKDTESNKSDKVENNTNEQ